MCEVIERIVRGPEPVVMDPGLLTPLPWPEWGARIRSLAVDGARADYVEVDPYRLEVPELRDRADAPVRMLLTVVLSGICIGEIDGRPVRLGPRSAALVDGRAAMRFDAPAPVRAVRLFVEEHHLPAVVLARFTGPYALLKPSPLVNGCVGFITGLLQVGNPVVDQLDATAVSGPLIALQASLLNEALHESAVQDPAPVTRTDQIDAHIERHLAERDLTVGAIAAALGVTVRTVHAEFAGTGTTVAHRIRERRVARVKAVLAARREPPNIGVLASRVGLSRDQLSRAFRSSTGQSVPEWWAEHHPV